MSQSDGPQWGSVHSNGGSDSGQPPKRRSTLPGRQESSAAPASSPKPAQVPSRKDLHATGKPKKKRKVGKTIGLTALFTFLIIVIGVCVGFLVAYNRTQIPKADEFALAQTTTVYYGDGTTEMGTFAEVNRTIVDPKDLPAYVGQAVVASEDRTFYTNSGVDIKGIARALVNNVSGGERQGASTLSQQYVENYYMGIDKEKTYMDKIRQAILALKINRSENKDEILGNYLNTVYFGRGTYGIEAAAEAYFGVPAKDLTLSEAAMLAGILPSPTYWDPAVDPAKSQERWARVLNLMVEDGWISAAEAKEQKFPEVLEPGASTKSETGSVPYLMQQVKTELMEQGGLTGEEIDAGGLKVYTTIDPAKQRAAEDARNVLPEDTPDTVRVALTSIDNATGEILAEYPGDDFDKIQTNAATQDIAMAGSTFKPFALLNYVDRGGSVYDTFNGNSPQWFVDTEVENNAGVSFGYVNMVTATMYSINTAYVNLNEKAGPDKTKETLVKMGIPEDTVGLEDNLLNVLGSAAPHNIDLAAAYSTFANGGQRVTPHIVREVKNPNDSTIYRPSVDKTQEFTSDVIASMMPALLAVTDEGGTGAKVTELGRAVAGKTGTSDEQMSAQFIGFIPQITTAVSMFGVDADGNQTPLPNIGGIDEFHGGDWPVDMWLAYMNTATIGMDYTDFDWYVAAQQQQQQQQYQPQYNAPPAYEEVPDAPETYTPDDNTDTDTDVSTSTQQPEGSQS